MRVSRTRSSLIPAVALMGQEAVGTSTEEVLENAHLNYRMSKEPIYTEGGKIINNGKTVRVFREDTDKTLGIVGHKYEIAQNKDVFDVAMTLQESEDIQWDRVGSMNDGSQIFGSFILPDHITIGDNENETFEQRIYLFNANDGSGGLKALPTNMRLFCQNQTTAVLRQLRAWGINPRDLSIRHSSKMSERISDLKRILRLTNHMNIRFAEDASRLMRVEMTDAEMTEVFIDTFGWTQKTDKKTGEIITDNHPYGLATRGINQLETLNELLTSETNTTGGMAGSAWACYNAITEYIDHHGILKADGSHKETSVMNTVFGIGARRKAKAWNNLMEMVV